MSSCDAPILRTTLRKAGIEVPAFQTFCIMQCAQAYMEVDFYPSLDEAAAYLGVPIQEPRHSALGDAKTARGVLLKIASS